MKSKMTKDFIIYYLNFNKVYEIAMMINNVILTKIDKNQTKKHEKHLGSNASASVDLLGQIKSSLSSDIKETKHSSLSVIESLDVKTTKSILLRKVIELCSSISSFSDLSEGDLIKIDNVKLEILDEETLRQFLVLRRDIFKGLHVEGIEINNIVSSMLQDYAYILKGKINSAIAENEEEIIIKIPFEIQTEFENKYIINDLLIGHVSIVGVYKGKVSKTFISSNTITYFQGIGTRQQSLTSDKPIKSNSVPERSQRTEQENVEEISYFIDTLAIIQDVSFKFATPPKKLNFISIICNKIYKCNNANKG